MDEPTEEPGVTGIPTPARPNRRWYRLALVGVVIALAAGALAWFTGDVRLWLIGLVWIFGLVGVFVLSRLLAAGLILLLHRVGLIDDEAAGRMGYLHGLGLLMLPVMGFMVLNPGTTIWWFGIPVIILSFFGFDVLVAIAFKLGLSKRRSLSERIGPRRRPERRSLLEDPGRATAAIAVDAHMQVLRMTEREHYSRGEAVGRLLLIATLPLFMVGVFGVMFAVGGFDGTPLMIFGFLGGALCLAIGPLSGTSHDRR